MEGHALRCETDLEGAKRFALHGREAARPVHPWSVVTLEARGLVLCNDKFPTATYVLTGRGASEAVRLSRRPLRPLSARRPEDE